MSLRVTHAAVAISVLTEAFAWWIALRALGSAWARDGFSVLAEKLGRAGTLGDEARVNNAIAIARDASLHATGGPSFLIVVATAAVAFVCMRWAVQQRLPLPLMAALVTALSLLAFHVFLHVAVAGDWRIWESSAVIRMIGPGTAVFGERLEVATFLANPDPNRVIRESITVTVVGVMAVWLRFLIGGRMAFSHERVLSSFGLWFGILLVVAFLTNLTKGVNVLGFILVYFVLGALSLAVAHATRAQLEETSFRRTAPWLTSLAVTLGAVAGLGLLFGLLTFIDAGFLFEPVVDGVVWIVSRLAFLILYPFAVVMTWIFEAIFQGRTIDLDTLTRTLGQMEPPESQGLSQLVPNWVSTSFRMLALLIATWLLYRLASAILGARRRSMASEDYVELRSVAPTADAPNIFGGLFRRRGNDANATAWLRRHAIYALFGRVVQDAHARGLQRAVSDTPIEFGGVAASRLAAPPFEPIARAFDQSRYGRHYPEAAEVEALERDLAAWEREHPTNGERHPS